MSRRSRRRSRRVCCAGSLRRAFSEADIVVGHAKETSTGASRPRPSSPWSAAALKIRACVPDARPAPASNAAQRAYRTCRRGESRHRLVEQVPRWISGADRALKGERKGRAQRQSPLPRRIEPRGRGFESNFASAGRGCWIPVLSSIAGPPADPDREPSVADEHLRGALDELPATVYSSPRPSGLQPNALDPCV